MLRVLVVDDSPTARALIAAMLREDDAITVAGEAVSGEEAVRMTADLRPDIVTMDIHMPKMSGFEATKQIMMATPTPIVIVSSDTTVDEVATGMRALRAGALTLLRKPPGPESADYAEACADLIETVKSMADVKVVRHFRPPAPLEPICDLGTPGSETSADDASPRITPVLDPHSADAAAWGVIALAASTGGPPAIQQVLAALPLDFPLPILVVQHIAKGFTDGFARWLDTTVPLPVRTAEPGVPLRAGQVYVAPEDGHLGVSPARLIEISAAPPIAGFRPSASFLFNSVAGVFREGTLAVIMTGMGSDGVGGLRAVKRHGGMVVAQDAATSVVFGMPGAALDAKVVDQTLGVDQIAQRIQQFTRQRTCR